MVSHSALIISTMHHALDPSTTSMLWFYLVYLIQYCYLSVKFVMRIVKQKIENKRSLYLIKPPILKFTFLFQRYSGLCYRQDSSRLVATYCFRLKNVLSALFIKTVDWMGCHRCSVILSMPSSHKHPFYLFLFLNCVMWKRRK